MSINFAILGFLSWSPASGYDLKRLFEDSPVFPWSGNNNQVYKALVELHKTGLVTYEVEQQADYPPRKMYTVTEQGRAALSQWVVSEPELPQLRNAFLVQLAWADQLAAGELEGLLGRYEDEIEVELAMFREHRQRHKVSPRRTPRETYLWDMILESRISFYENELRWVRKLRSGLDVMQTGGAPES